MVIAQMSLYSTLTLKAFRTVKKSTISHKPSNRSRSIAATAAKSRNALEMTYHAAVSFFTSHSANSGVQYTEHADIAEVQHSGGDLAPSLRGTQNIFADQDF